MFTQGVTAAGLIQAAHQDSARSSLQTDPICSHPSLWENSQPLEEAGLLMQLENQSSVQVNSQQMNLSTTSSSQYPKSTHTSLPCCPALRFPKESQPASKFLTRQFRIRFSRLGVFSRICRNSWVSSAEETQTQAGGRVRAAPVHQDNPLI